MCKANAIFAALLLWPLQMIFIILLEHDVYMFEGHVSCHANFLIPTFLHSGIAQWVPNAHPGKPQFCD